MSRLDPLRFRDDDGAAAARVFAAQRSSAFRISIP